MEGKNSLETTFPLRRTCHVTLENELAKTVNKTYLIFDVTCSESTDSSSLNLGYLSPFESPTSSRKAHSAQNPMLDQKLTVRPHIGLSGHYPLTHRRQSATSVNRLADPFLPCSRHTLITPMFQHFPSARTCRPIYTAATGEENDGKKSCICLHHYSRVPGIPPSSTAH